MATSLTFFMTMRKAVINFEHPHALEQRLIDQLTKLFDKKDIDLVESEDSSMKTADLVIEFITIEQGNQLLRYLLPFISPAYIELDVKLSGSDSKPHERTYKQTSQVGLFGGSGSGMLNVAVDRIAKRIVKDVLKARA